MLNTRTLNTDQYTETVVRKQLDMLYLCVTK